MSRFDDYSNTYPNARLTRSADGVLEIALHTDGSKLVFNGHTHEQFVDLFHDVGSDPDNRVVILTGTGDAFMDAVLLHSEYALLADIVLATPEKAASIIDEGLGLALEGISAAAVARAMYAAA